MWECGYRRGSTWCWWCWDGGDGLGFCFRGGGSQLCANASLSSRWALSSVQEMASVSAVSLMANEFPGGGVVATNACVFVCVCVFGWQRLHGRTERGKTEKKATRILWEPLHTRFQGHTTGRGAFTTLLWLPGSFLCCALKPHPEHYRKTQGSHIDKH